jgi:L-fuconolactonase
LKATLALLTRYPELRAIVDHCGKPDIAQGMWQPWADGMRRIARETTAYCKLSGVVTEARPGWQVDELRRYAEHVIECFGPDRVAWGSDWPVMLLNADYARWLDAAKQLIAPLSASQQAGIMSRNAVSLYRLQV